MYPGTSWNTQEMYLLLTSTLFRCVGPILIKACRRLSEMSRLVSIMNRSMLLAMFVASIVARAADSASATLPTLVPTPSQTPIGNATSILTYPPCAQVCANETRNAACDGTQLECACDATYRSRTSACEVVTCSFSDYNSMSDFAQWKTLLGSLSSVFMLT